MYIRCPESHITHVAEDRRDLLVITFTNLGEMSQTNLADHLPPRPIPGHWTASRCNRTLRKINTFVKQLEKWHKDHAAFQASCEKDAEAEEDSSAVKHTDKEKGQEDADWLSKGTGKRGDAKKKTYASRGNPVPTTPAVKRRPLGKLSLRTPSASASAQLTYPSVRVADPEKPVNDDRNGSYAARKFTNHNKLPLLQDYDVPLGDPKAKQTTMLTWRHEQLINYGTIAIAQFLVATSDPELPNGWHDLLDKKQNAAQDAREYGAKSLVSMCLAKLGESLVDEQKESDEKKDGYDGECDVVGSQLEELQDYFGNSKTGWPYLRDLTRTYGIAMVRRLVESGALEKSDARGLAVSAFGSPLLADFGEALAETLIQIDTGRNELFLEQGGTPGFGAYGAYNFDEGDYWREMMKFRWLTLAIRQEPDPRFVIKHLARFHVLRNAYTSCMRLRQVSAAGLIETTFSRLLWQNSQEQQEDLHHKVQCIRAGAHFELEETCGTSLTGLLENRLTVVTRMFYSQPTEWTNRLMEKICTQIQLSMEWCQVQGLPRTQKLIIAQVFFVDLCLDAWYRRNLRKSLPASFEALLSECDGNVVKQMEACMVATLLAVRADDVKFMASITLILGIQCAGYERVHKLLARVCAEAAMDYAADQLEQDTSTRTWASRIEAESRIRNKGSSSNYRPRSVVREHREEWHGYRWDDDVREWVERSAKKTRAMRLTTKIQQVDGACESPPPAKNPCLPNKQVHEPMDQGLKRKKNLYVFEVHRDNEFDFEYKKPRLIVPKSLEDHPDGAFRAGTPTGGCTAKLCDEEESEDELSLLD